MKNVKNILKIFLFFVVYIINLFIFAASFKT